MSEEFTEEEVQQMTQELEWLFKYLKKKDIEGYRATSGSAWYSPQRDLVHWMPNILYSAGAISRLMFTEEEQEKMGDIYLELMQAVNNQEKGVPAIPSIIQHYYEKDPELMTRYLTCVGYMALFILSILPACAVNPDGYPESDLQSDAVLSMAMSHLTPETREKVKEELEGWSKDLLAPTAFSDEMYRITGSLREALQNRKEREKKKKKSKEEKQEEE